MITLKVGVYLGILLMTFTWGVIFYNKISYPYKLTTQMVAFVIVGELVGFYLKNTLGSSFPMYHFLQPILLFYYAYIFYALTWKYYWIRLLVFVIALLLISVSLFLNFYYYDFYSFPSISIILLSIYAVCGSLLLLTILLKNPNPSPIWIEPLFWLSSGTLVFYSITFFFFSYYDYLLNANSIPNWGYQLNRFFNYVMYFTTFLSLFFESHKK